jgi:hypothetical protein
MINRPTYGLTGRRMIATTHANVVLGSIIMLMMLAGTGTTIAEEQLSAGSSSKHLRKQTVNSLPYQQLNAETKNKIADVLNKPSIYRRLPVTSISADPDYYRFLVRYPEVIVNIWQLMGVTEMATDRTGPYEINTDDGAGTISSLELVYGSDNLHIFYGTGTYEGPILKRKLKGRAVLVLRSENTAGTDGKPVTTSQLDVFLKIENATAGIIAKSISPLVGTTADHNFVESLKFVQRLNETTSKNGPGVQQMGTKLKIDDSVRQRFNEVVEVVFQRAINASAPTDRSSPNAQYSTSTPTPTSSLKPASSTQRPGVYQTLKDYSQVRPTNLRQLQGGNQGAGNPTSQYRPSPSQPHQMANGYQLPARGYQAPAYTQPLAGNYAYQYQQQNRQPVQASYDNNNAQQQNAVQPAGGWRARQ